MARSLGSISLRVGVQAWLLAFVASPALLVGGCLDTNPPEGVFTCTQATVATDCPSGWSCRDDGYCYRDATLDAGTTLDASTPNDGAGDVGTAADSSTPNDGGLCSSETECDDGDGCTVDTCEGGSCVHAVCPILPGMANVVPRCEAGACHYDCVAGYHDANGDVIDGCEYACDFSPGEDDVPDGSGKDTNCDGADGVVGVTVYVTYDGRDDGDGTSPATAINLARAVQLLESSGGLVTMLFAEGTYATEVPIHPLRSFEFFGGYAEDFRSRDTSRTVRITYLKSAAPRAIEVVDIEGRIDGFSIETVDQDAPGVATSTLWIDNSPSFTLRDATVTAGQGGAGADGADGAVGATGAPGNNGLAGSGTSGGSGGAGVGLGIRLGGAGGAGGTVPNSGANGGSGGAPCSASGGRGGDADGAVSGAVGWAGTRGTAGCSGTASSAHGGAGQATVGNVDMSGWTAETEASGGSGGNGTDGGGGGGGGGGGAANNRASNWGGGGGGSGGEGGGGGRGGEGGRPGGASIGLLSRSSIVYLIGAVDFRVGRGGAGGRGGDGGLGGSGGSGGIGGPGANWETGTGSRGGTGGDGGAGGAGGRGACGGGGAGGPSVAIFASGGDVDESTAMVTIDLPPTPAPGGRVCPVGGGRAGLQGIIERRVTH